MLKRLHLLTKIVLLGVFIIVLFMSVLLWMQPKFKGMMFNEKQLKTRHLVETAWGILDYYQRQVENGKMTKEEAQEAVKQMVKVLRYEKEDYFWINDSTPRMVVHPFKPELDGKDLSENKDPNGKRLFVEFEIGRAHV